VVSYYETLLEEIAEGALNDRQRSIFALLKRHPEGLTRHELVQKLDGYTPLDINNDRADRRNRKAIELMRQRLFPIVSDSRKAGYRLDTSRDAVLKMIAELQSRKQKIQITIDAAAKFYNIPVEYVDETKVTQLELI
jgi:hypothetical protein